MDKVAKAIPILPSVELLEDNQNKYAPPQSKGVPNWNK